jgi:hypothetical protein
VKKKRTGKLKKEKVQGEKRGWTNEQQQQQQQKKRAPERNARRKFRRRRVRVPLSFFDLPLVSSFFTEVRLTRGVVAVYHNKVED